jgi:hypothetical protein
MPIYPIVNKVTREQKEVSFSIEEWERFKYDNKDWIRDWSDPSTAPNTCEAGEWRDKLIKSHPGWNDILEKSSKSGGSKNQIGKI